MWYFTLSLVVILLDQASKRYMSSILPLCDYRHCPIIEILPVLQLRLLHNTGAAFSFLADAGGWQRWFLVMISVVLSSIIAVWLYRVRNSEKLLAFALALVLGGAVGNLLDRVAMGYVVDFILVHYEDWYFPAFNVADSAISVGGALLIADIFLKPRQEQVNE